jgi:hypothetical protein
MPHGKEKTIYMKFTPLLMKNGRYFKSQDEIFIKGEGCNTLGVNSHICTCISIA